MLNPMYDIILIPKSNSLTNFDGFEKPNIPQVSIKTLQKDQDHNIKVHQTNIDLYSLYLPQYQKYLNQLMTKEYPA